MIGVGVPSVQVDHDIDTPCLASKNTVAESSSATLDDALHLVDGSWHSL